MNDRMKFSLIQPIKLLLITLIFLFLTACASVDYSQEAKYPEATSEQALIYFYRTPGFIGSTYRFNVNEGDKLVGAMAQDSYFYLFADAGEYSYSVPDQNTESRPSILMNVEVNKVYYVKVDVEYQMLGGKVVFTEVDKSEAMKLLSSRKYVVHDKSGSSNYNVHAEQ